MNVRPRKRFGQHFLTCETTIERIVRTIAPQQDDTLVEIGPGRGAITRPLAECGAELHAIEFDRDLVPWLKERFADRPNVSIVEGDAMRFDFGSLGRGLRIVGNLPYNISTPLLFRLIGFQQSLKDLHFMLQKEVVDRLAAAPGNKAFGRLTIMLGHRLAVEPLFEVPASAFEPPPAVTSAMVRLTPRSSGAAANEALLRRLVARAFSQRRKTLRNSLKGMVPVDQLEAAGIDPGARPEEVAVATWVALADRLDARSRESP